MIGGFRHRMARAIAMAVTATIVVTTLGACVGAPETATSPSADVRLYTGAIPEPAALVGYSIAAMPEMPQPPTDFSDEAAMAEYQQAVEEYVKAFDELDSGSGGDLVEFAAQVGVLAEATRTSDAASVAAWQSLLVAAGIAVGYADNAVEVSGMEGAGIPMTSAELRLHAVLGALQTRMPLTELAGVIGAFGIFGDDDLTQALYNDLQTQAATGFGTVFAALDAETFGTMRYGEFHVTPIDEVTLTGAQVALVLRKLSVDLLLAAEEHGGIDTAVALVSAPGHMETAALVTRHADTGARAASSVDAVCGAEEEPWEIEARKNIGKGVGWGFGEVVGKALDGTTIGHSLRLAAAVAVGAVALSTLMTKMFSLEARFSMGDAPLVRSKERTAGERRQISVAFSYPKNTMDDVRNCVSKLLAPFGIDVADKTEGAASGIDVNLMLKGERLQYGNDRDGTDRYHQQTGVNGVALFTVDGKGQSKRLPDGAEPEETTSLVQADANIEGADLLKDLLSAGWDALGPSVSGILGNVASRMKLLSFVWDAPVRDWTLAAEFDVKLSGELWSHFAINRSGTSETPCGAWTQSWSTDGSGTVATNGPTRSVVEYVTTDNDGSAIEGMIFYSIEKSLRALPSGPDGAELARFPVTYAVDKSVSEPASDPLPEHFQEPGVGGCGDGGPGASTPQSDCGPRSYDGWINAVINDGAVHITSDPAKGNPWSNCGGGFFPDTPLMATARADSCPSAQKVGGGLPDPDVVFSERGSFEVSGEMRCSRDGDGALSRYVFSWTLTFCRVVDGKSTGCE